MDQSYYIKNMLSKLDISKSTSYCLRYKLTQIKRFSVKTLFIFIFQYLLSFHSLPDIFPLPFHPPMGFSFICFYLFGYKVILGLFLGEFLAYFLNGVPNILIMIYLISDLGLGMCGGLLSRTIFSSDIRPFENIKESLKFLKFNAVFTFSISALFKTSVFWSINFGALPLNFTINLYFDLYLSDLNAMIIFSGIALSWFQAVLSRIQISTQKISRLALIILFLLLALSIIGIRNQNGIFIIALLMIYGCYFVHRKGSLISTAMIFGISSLSLGYFTRFKYIYIEKFGFLGYSFLILFFLILNFIIFFIGYNFKKQ